MDSLDTFGPDDLPPAEKALYNRLFQQGKMQFCDIFGPDKIISHYGLFFDHFLPHFGGCRPWPNPVGKHGNEKACQVACRQGLCFR